MSVAVLGASGFIGSRIVEMFHLNALAEVRPITRSYAGMARQSRFTLEGHIADGFDQKALEAAFSGCDTLVHTIAGDPQTILGTLAPAYRAAQKAGIKRLIYMSTASVHGQAPAPEMNEESPLSERQVLPYNNAKVKAEKKLRKLRESGNVELVILRPGIVFGPRSSWIVGFADDLIAGKAYLINRGRGICNSIYVDNLVHAVHRAMHAPDVDGEAFLVGDREQVTWADLYSPISEALGYRLAQVPEAVISGIKPSRFEQLEGIRNSKPVQAALSIFPMRLRQAAYAAYAYLGHPPPESPWELPVPEEPAATLEMSLLYQCQYKFPAEKAKRMLGYEPLVPFAEGCRRSIGWLAFAGYPLIPGYGIGGSVEAFKVDPFPEESLR